MPTGGSVGSAGEIGGGSSSRLAIEVTAEADFYAQVAGLTENSQFLCVHRLAE
jgi:hypothetical protein